MKHPKPTPFWGALSCSALAFGAIASAQPAPSPPPAPAPAPPAEPAGSDVVIVPPLPAAETDPPVQTFPAADPAEATQSFDEVVVTEAKRTFRFLVFGDINLGLAFGDPRDSEAAEQFEQFGLDAKLKNTHEGFGLAGTDFVLLGEIAKDIHYLGEVNFQVERGRQSEFEIDVERMFLDYNFSEYFGLQAGLFFTPIGYHNRKQYSRAWLSISATVPALFEEEYGFVPTHTIGVNAYGSIPVARGDLRYAVSFGNGRAVDPSLNLYSRDATPSAVTAGLEYQQRSARETAFGVAGWIDHIDTFRVDSPGGSVNILTPGAPAIGVRELGLNAFLAADTEQLGVLLEYALIRHDVTEGTVLAAQEKTTVHGVFAELAYHATPTVHPYVRYDRISVPDGAGPYLPLRLEGETLTRFYVPSEDMVSLGVAWDRTGTNRLKAEYTVSLEGPRALHSIIFQTAFGIQ